jgi:TRAP-type C4-dicarboxylate transport system permease small subunit
MFLLIPMMLLTTCDVIGRVLWARPITGTVELSSYTLAVFILLGLAYTHQVKGHVRVTFLIAMLPPRGQSVVEIVTILLSLFIISILAWQGWIVGIEERTVSDMLRIPQLPFRLLVSLAGVFLCLELLIDLSAAIGKLIRK